MFLWVTMHKIMTKMETKIISCQRSPINHIKITNQSGRCSIIITHALLPHFLICNYLKTHIPGTLLEDHYFETKCINYKIALSCYYLIPAVTSPDQILERESCRLPSAVCSLPCGVSLSCPSCPDCPGFFKDQLIPYNHKDQLFKHMKTCPLCPGTLIV